MIERLVEILQEVWLTKAVPVDWSVAKISAIWKRKGSVLDATKYRGISVSSVLAKICMNI